MGLPAKAPVHLPTPLLARAAAACDREGVVLADWLADLIDCALAVETVAPPPAPRVHARARTRANYRVSA